MAVGRVSTQFQSAQFIQQVFDQQQALAKLRDEVATGYKVTDPSDAPGPAGTIVDLQDTINRLARHKDRIGYATNLLSGQDSAMTSAEDVMQRAQEIATQAANESLSTSQRAQLSSEVWALRDTLVGLANTKVMGKFIYAGTADTTAPMTLGTLYNFPATAPDSQHYVFTTAPGTTSGINDGTPPASPPNNLFSPPGQTIIGEKYVAISDNETVRVNTVPAPGSYPMFQQANDALERLGRALDGYRTDPQPGPAPYTDPPTPDAPINPTVGGAAFVFPTDYHAQTSAIQNALDEIKIGSNAFIAERSDVGGRMNHLTQASQVIDGISADAEKSRSDMQDADAFDVASKLSSLQTSFQALLATGAQINKLSLLDYL